MYKTPALFSELGTLYCTKNGDFFIHKHTNDVFISKNEAIKLRKIKLEKLKNG